MWARYSDSPEKGCCLASPGAHLSHGGQPSRPSFAWKPRLLLPALVVEGSESGEGSSLSTRCETSQAHWPHLQVGSTRIMQPFVTG